MIFNGNTIDILPKVKLLLNADTLPEVILPVVNTLPVAAPPILLQKTPS
jgi:hypothetical protein